MSKHVALVGTCPSSKLFAPYGEADVEIWACGPDNAGDGVLPRITAWFEIHGDLCLPGNPAFERSYAAWVNTAQARDHFDVIAQRLDLFPQAKVLPFDALVGIYGRLPFTSSLAWMLAHAMSSGFTKIGLYGIDMSAREEYAQQRPGMQMLIGRALAEGIDVYAPAESDILQPNPLYGFERSSPYARKLEVRRREVAARKAGLDAQIAAMQRESDGLGGALDDIDYHQTIWTGGFDALAPAKPQEK